MNLQIVLATVTSALVSWSAGCGMPEAPCDRIDHCAIDRSCGGSLPGGSATYEACGQEASCEAIVQCVGDAFAAHAEASVSNPMKLSILVNMCGDIPDYIGPIATQKTILDACDKAFGALLATADQSASACRSLQSAGRLGPDYAARAKKACM